MKNTAVCLASWPSQCECTLPTSQHIGFEAPSSTLPRDKSPTLPHNEYKSPLLTSEQHKQCEARPSIVLYELWLEITRSCTHNDPEEIVRTFYNWITTHIQYDVNKLSSLMQVQPNKLASKLAVSRCFLKGAVKDNCEGEEAACTGKGVCTGFTDLLYHLCW
jgi:hypothetical protein